MKKNILLLFLLIFLPLLTGCGQTSANTPTARRVEYYDISFEIDPGQGIFRSKQRVTFSGIASEGKKLSISIGENLVIDRLQLTDESRKELPIKEWRKAGRNSVEIFGETIDYSQIEIQTVDDIPAGRPVIVSLDYHLPAEEIKEGLPESMYSLFVSPQGSHAGGPESGAFVLVSDDMESSFKISIRHPDIYRCVLPGELISTEENGGYTTVTYQAKSRYDPSFSCAPYEVMNRKVDGMLVELYHPPQYVLSSKMLDKSAETIDFFLQKFGKPQSDSFRIVFPDLANLEGGGESNGNLILLGNIQPFLDYDNNEEGKDIFAHLVAHEGYHMWNAWDLDWEGPCEEWWVEGGANFMPSWAKEELIGRESGANNRLRSEEAFIEQKAYLHRSTLATLDDTWFEHYALVYDYGALVWEQLRQAAGSDALAAGLRDMYAERGRRPFSTGLLIDSVEKHTRTDLDPILAQWTDQNARVDLAVSGVSIRPLDGKFEVQVDLNVFSDQDYVLFTAVGYKTSHEGRWQVIDLKLTGSGPHTVRFESSEKPLEIRIDPEYRVPQVNLENNAWVEGAVQN